MIGHGQAWFLFLAVTGVCAKDVDPSECSQWDEQQPELYIFSYDSNMQGDSFATLPSPSELDKRSEAFKTMVQLFLAGFFIVLGTVAFPQADMVMAKCWPCFLCLAFVVNTAMSLTQGAFEFMMECFLGRLSFCCDTRELQNAIEKKRDDSPKVFFRAFLTVNVALAHVGIIKYILQWSNCPKECKMCTEGKEFYEMCTLAVANYLVFEKWHEIEEKIKERRESPEESEPETVAMKALQWMGKIYEGMDQFLTGIAFLRFWAGMLPIESYLDWFPTFPGALAIFISGLDSLVDMVAAFLAYQQVQGRQQEPDNGVPYAVME